MEYLTQLRALADKYNTIFTAEKLADTVLVNIAANNADKRYEVVITTLRVTNTFTYTNLPAQMSSTAVYSMSCS